MKGGDITKLLQDVRAGGKEAWNELFARIYRQLHRLAAEHRRGERAHHTLQTTALVNEAFLRLAGERDRSYANRSHFLAIASSAMRRVLVDYAERRNAIKRGAGRAPLELHEAVSLFESPAEDLLALDEALNELAEVDPAKSRLVELRFFGGLTMEETAQVMDAPLRTVERSWRLAKAFLRDRIDHLPEGRAR